MHGAVSQWWLVLEIQMQPGAWSALEHRQVQILIYSNTELLAIRYAFYAKKKVKRCLLNGTFYKADRELTNMALSANDGAWYAWAPWSANLPDLAYIFQRRRKLTNRWDSRIVPWDRFSRDGHQMFTIIVPMPASVYSWDRAPSQADKLGVYFLLLTDDGNPGRKQGSDLLALNEQQSCR